MKKTLLACLGILSLATVYVIAGDPLAVVLWAVFFGASALHGGTDAPPVARRFTPFRADSAKETPWRRC
jgi:hypothetical protein